MQLLLSFYLLAASAYVMLAIRGLLRLNHPAPRADGDCPPMTVLKPLHGDEPGLFENLLSFCQQDYPQYQVIFGVSKADDAAVAVARRVIRLQLAFWLGGIDLRHGGLVRIRVGRAALCSPWGRV